MKKTRLAFSTSLGTMEYVVVDLIKAVEARPVVYDPKLKFARGLSARNRKEAAWKEIALELVPKLEKLSESELQNIINRYFRSKWGRMTEALVKQTQLEEEEGKKPYMYRKEMEFVLTCGPNEGEISEDDEGKDDEDEENEEEKDVSQLKKEMPTIAVKKELLNEDAEEETRNSESQVSEIDSKPDIPPPRSARLRQRMTLASSVPVTESKTTPNRRATMTVTSNNTSQPENKNSNLCQRASKRKQELSQTRTSDRRTSEDFSKAATPTPSKKIKPNISSCTTSTPLNNTNKYQKEEGAKTTGPQLDICTDEPLTLCEAIENESMNENNSIKVADNGARDSIQQRNIAQESPMQRGSSTTFTQPIYGVHDAAERAFFDSLIPNVCNLEKTHKLDFQIEVLQLLKKYNK
ncbi:uncharacterized protein LOC142220036 [Haematobia irritans]|uniref:uncharacterized protein LOC142220036 n=1 Tax=Haematobia irritans TaxID=7368 RepID=UPI003F5098C3